MKGTNPVTKNVSVIDIGPFLDGTTAGQQFVAAQVAEACESIGFLTIVGHGVSPELLDEMYDTSKRFFDLPLEVKLSTVSPSPEVVRGYTPPVSTALAYSYERESPPDLRESFTINRLDAAEDEYFRRSGVKNLSHPNLWPERPERFQDVWSAYYCAMEALASTLLEIFAVALNLPQDFFSDKIDKHSSNLCAFNYPDQPGNPLPGQLRAGAHTDWGSLTILYQDQAPGGLQVVNQDGEWIDILPIPRSFVINIGDLMACWTNDRWVSTIHRVVNPPRDQALGSRRQSIAFFHMPNYDAMIACLESCSSERNPPKYPPMSAGEYLMMKLMQTMKMKREVS